MATLKKMNGENYLYSETQNYYIYLHRSWDLTNGLGWFCHAGTIGELDDDYMNSNEYKKLVSGFGFHKKNKFTAVRNALKFDKY
jgi:hypothetical protein